MSGPPIRLIVFDMAGTIIDHGSVAPVAALMTAFNELGLAAFRGRGTRSDGPREARPHRGRAAADRSRFPHDGRFSVTSRRRPMSRRSTSRFLPVQAAEAQSRTEPIPGAVSCLEALRRRSIAIGTTTGYPRSIGQPIADAARAGVGRRTIRFSRTM